MAPSFVNVSTTDSKYPLGPPRGISVYRYRWVILALYCLVALMNGFQWIQYSIISNIIQKYYDISAFTVDWFSMIFMVAYIPLIFPGMWLLDTMGLRLTVTLGALSLFLASWIKVFATSPDLFAVSFVGQTFAAISLVFVLSVPSRLAAVWFGPDQVSSACAIGVFGSQVGTALGFLLPPIIVQNHDVLDDIGNDLSVLFYSQAGFCSVLLVLVVTLFKNEPDLPPSVANAAQKSSGSKGTVKSLRRLMVNMNFVLVIVSYGMIIGVYCAISTLLNKVVLTFYPDAEEDAGRIGLTFIVTGMGGAVLSGMVLDKTHKYKETIVGLYVFSLVSMVIFTFTLNTGHIAVVYVTSGLLGFFMSGYLPVGFEVAAELTYPEPEGTSTALLALANQVSGILLTLLYSWLLRDVGDKWANFVLCVALVIGCVVTALLKKDYRRQAQSKKDLTTTSSPESIQNDPGQIATEANLVSMDSEKILV